MQARDIGDHTFKYLRLARIKLRLFADRRRLEPLFDSAGGPARFAAKAWATGREVAAIGAALRSFEWQFWTVFAVAATVMIVMQANVPLWFGGGDHLDYYDYGRYLLGWGPWRIPSPWRTPGMGIFHILSGTVLLGTWKGFTGLFALFSVAIPVFTYLMVRPHSPGFALLAALVVVLSMTPYVYATAAGDDHLYFFLHALVLWLCCLFLRRRADRGLALPVAIALIAAYLNIVRPVGALIYWMFVIVWAISRPRDWRRVAVASGLYVALMAGWTLWDRDYGTNGGATPTPFFGFADPIATKPERRFAEAYYSRAGLAYAVSDEAARGHPQTEMLRALLRRFLREHPEGWETPGYLTPPSLFSRYAGQPDAMLDALFIHPNTLYLAFILRVVDQVLGPNTSHLLMQVAYEHGTAGLYGALAYFVRDPGRLLLGATPNLSARTLFDVFYRSNLAGKNGLIYSFTGLPNPILTPDLGPSTTRLLAVLRNFIDDYPELWRIYGAPPGTPFAGGPDDFYRALASSDDTKMEPESVIYTIISSVLGAAPSSRLYMGVVRELLARYPRLALRFYDNLLNLTLMRKFGSLREPFDREWLFHHSDVSQERGAQVRTGLLPSLARGLVDERQPSQTLITAKALQTAVYLASPLFVCVLVVSLPLLRRRTIVVPAGFLLLVYSYEVAAIAVFTPWGAMRYEATFYVLPWVIACMIFGQAWSDRATASRRDNSP